MKISQKEDNVSPSLVLTRSLNKLNERYSEINSEKVMHDLELVNNGFIEHVQSLRSATHDIKPNVNVLKTIYEKTLRIFEKLIRDRHIPLMERKSELNEKTHQKLINEEEEKELDMADNIVFYHSECYNNIDAILHTIAEFLHEVDPNINIRKVDYKQLYGLPSDEFNYKNLETFIDEGLIEDFKSIEKRLVVDGYINSKKWDKTGTKLVDLINLLYNFGYLIKNRKNNHLKRYLQWFGERYHVDLSGYYRPSKHKKYNAGPAIFHWIEDQS